VSIVTRVTSVKKRKKEKGFGEEQDAVEAFLSVQKF